MRCRPTIHRLTPPAPHSCAHTTPPPHSHSPPHVSCVQYGILQCCEAHGQKGRRSSAFGGYAGENELKKYALKTLGKLASKYPTQVSRGLHLLVAPSYGGEPVLPPHLRQSWEAKLPPAPPNSPSPPPRAPPPPRDAPLFSGRTRAYSGAKRK